VATVTSATTASLAASTQQAPTATSTSPAAVAGAVNSYAAPLVNGNSAGGVSTSLQQYQNAGVRPAPFGSELFCGGNISASTVGVVDPGYIIKTGDSISVYLWGSVPDASLTAVVDTNGNITVPALGPVHVAGVPAGSVNQVVNSAAANVYRNAVHIYAAPVTTVPITVFITGPVMAPGPYAGLGSDSIIAFLQRAGGIDPNAGSYRNISVRRAGKVIAHIDLYPFLRTGEMTPVSLRNGDTIVVGQQGPVVAVTGAARIPFTFELGGPTGTGQEILYYARPRPEVNYAAVLGYRDAQPASSYETLADFAHHTLMDGDRVGFSADALNDSQVVQVAGAFHGPGAYVVTSGTTLGAVLSKITLDPMADRRWIHIERASVAASQKQLLTESLALLQRAIYTNPAPTAALQQANAAQAATIQTYIAFASQVQPVGDVAFPLGYNLDDVVLEPNDVIVIPFKSQIVTVGGDVNIPQAVIYQPGLTYRDYIKKAGGFDPLGDRGKVLVIHPDGSLEINGKVQPGDRVLVGVTLPGHLLDVAAALTAVIYQAAVGAKAAGA
jgi:protein involved in polysaccharide export with SLBB domain